MTPSFVPQTRLEASSFLSIKSIMRLIAAFSTALTVLRFGLFLSEKEITTSSASDNLLRISDLVSLQEATMVATSKNGSSVLYMEFFLGTAKLRTDQAAGVLD